MFLAIDTVFDQCSVAIVSQDLQVISDHTETGKRDQTQQILPMIDSALQQAGIKLADITALIFNRGPGPFSGIRINTAVIQALSVAHNIPCVGVSSLAAIAQAAFDKQGVQQVYAALDARMKQVYFGEYQLAQMQGTPDVQVMTQVEGSEERLVDYDQSTDKALPIAGNGATLLHAVEDQPLFAEIIPDAVSLAKLGIAQYLVSGGVSADQALPVYLRNNAWKTLKEQGKA
ncbi:tRNA (adenosine(37)-N6)-threonylcarbamoyltransferase complex dimerization subunit type 1 TsaB [Psychrobacter sp. YP14]|uniref:tRNA threonylcarbamoyladenosine biosynthesis protein TsaB n=2 Tax=Psychrobacter TaxID=497 RepID=A5WCV4_PSYWF|nr:MULTISPECIES: tRNA (adenosine(37)-N6)-threonylcarbamoyltransferase complex dimerization subunit type 1 TsaB [unclassified Psychrobacter]AWT48565.1 tRNA (adenosine(37)-N6)-threonylcarbamoyltransferase complex dimerization subunit type 1 TsaB [Psychrobacter sp. YP14]UNK05895.1 tRNA (adenosine(37)-N6)-threonylcarbamoyltransferase complex dimerization subunit type 1 TsaB [Psychrobacter sp. PraFG1]